MHYTRVCVYLCLLACVRVCIYVLYIHGGTDRDVKPAVAVRVHPYIRDPRTYKMRIYARTSPPFLHLSRFFSVSSLFFSISLSLFCRYTHTHILYTPSARIYMCVCLRLRAYPYRLVTPLVSSLANRPCSPRSHTLTFSSRAKVKA